MEYFEKAICPGDGPICILDDSEVDLFMARRCFFKSKLKEKFELREFADPASLLIYLRQFIGKDKASFPSLILLDINMPGASGFDVLQQIRSIADFAELPYMIMLTNSQNSDDIEKSRMKGANGYQVKPFMPSEYVDFFNSFNDQN